MSQPLSHGRRAAPFAPAIALALALALGGCRSVWVHDCWHPGRYEQESAACKARQTAQQEAGVPAVPWKDCMVELGWLTEISHRGDVVSKPTRGTGAFHSTPRRSLAQARCARDLDRSR